MIDQEIKRIVDAMLASGFVLPDPIDANSLRAMLNTPLAGEAIELDDVRDVEIEAVPVPLRARLYLPLARANLPVAFLFHGGGWVIGSLETHDRLARSLARASQCAIISVEYRLAPENPYPVPLDDCLSAIMTLPKIAARHAIDPYRFAVIGDSAGGNLAAAVALKLRGAERAPLAQILLYPVLNNNFDTGSYRQHADCATLPASLMRYFWNAYLGSGTPDDFARPLTCRNLAGVAPATLILAGIDPLHDEGAAYAERLCAAGVPTSVHEFPGAVHGFASFVGLAALADEAVGIAGGAIATALC